MYRLINPKIRTGLTVLSLGIIALVGFGIYQAIKLERAHSTFEKYYAFRGCTILLERKSDYGICRTKSGDMIRIVKINNKWYLEGDGPGVW